MRPSRSSRPRRSSASRPSCSKSTLCPARSRRCSRKKADRVLVCFEQAKKLLGGDEKIILTGAPVRGEILAASREKARAKFGLAENDQLVVSFWGLDGCEVHERAHGRDPRARVQKRRFPTTMSTPTGAAARDWLPKNGARAGRGLREPPEYPVHRIHLRHGGPHGGGRPYRVPRRCGDARRAVHARPSGAARAVPLRRGEPSGEERARARVGRAAAACCSKKDATPQKLYDEIGDMLSDPLRLHAMGENATVLAAHDASEKRSTVRSSGRSKTTASKAEHA